MVRIIHVNVQMTCKVRLYLVWYLLFILVWYKKWEKFALDLEKYIRWRYGIRWNPTRHYAYVHMTSYCSGTHVYPDLIKQDIFVITYVRIIHEGHVYRVHKINFWYECKTLYVKNFTAMALCRLRILRNSQMGLWTGVLKVET